MFEREDSFIELIDHLPVVAQESASEDTLLVEDRDPFQSWIINRYNRIGAVTFGRYISSSMRRFASHPMSYLSISAPFVVFICTLRYFHLEWVAAMISVIFGVLAFAIVYSRFCREQLSSVIARALKPKGSLCILCFALPSITLHGLFNLVEKRSSLALGCIALNWIIEWATFFIPLFIFDSQINNVKQILVFSFRALERAKTVTLSMLIMFSFVCKIIGLFTLGASLWVSTWVKVLYFASVCGTSSPREDALF